MAPNESSIYEVTIRHARLDEVPLLGAVETSAATVFRTVNDLGWIADMPPMDLALLRSMVSHKRVWVAVPSKGSMPVAFSAAEPKDGLFYIAEVSVHHAWQRRGIARKLIAEMERQARAEAFTYISLTTYRALDWNGQFYAKVGFVEVEPMAAGLKKHVTEIEEQGKQGHDVTRRCVMWKRL
jgi:GNAT superfamily N-acetyltransferase